MKGPLKASVEDLLAIGQRCHRRCRLAVHAMIRDDAQEAGEYVLTHAEWFDAVEGAFEPVEILRMARALAAAGVEKDVDVGEEHLRR